MPAAELLKDIPDACNPRIVIPVDDPHQYYVYCNDVRGDGGLKNVESLIRKSSTTTHQLVTGHTGCGKSTEILRLKSDLEKEKDNKKFKVIFLDADKKLDLNNIDFADILLAIGEQLELLERKWGVTKLPQWERMLTEIRKFTDDSDFTFSLGVLSVKSGGDKRLGIRKAFGNYLAQIIGGINKVLGKLREVVKKNGYTDIVFIIDNLEKIIPITDEFGKTNHDAIFVDRASLLTDLNVHLLMTAPLSMCHLSESAPRLGSLYDGEPATIPMIKVWDRENEHEYHDGLEMLEKIVTKRVQVKLFDSPDTIREICKISGGVIRDLLRIVRSASLDCDKPPITLKEVDRAVNKISNSYNRVIGSSLELLKSVYKNKQFPNNIDVKKKKAALHELYVLEYYNGDQWYDIHPIIHKARVFKEYLIQG